MNADWAELNRITDNVLIAAGIAFLVLRQFFWRPAELGRMLRLPLLVIAGAAGYLVVELRAGFGWVPADWLVVGELVLVAVTGTAMGYVTHFRRRDNQLQYRLTTAGLVLWAVLLLLRGGDIVLAEHLGANVEKATGLILLSFGVTRLAAIMVVRRRARALAISGVGSTSSAATPEQGQQALGVVRAR